MKRPSNEVMRLPNRVSKISRQSLSSNRSGFESDDKKFQVALHKVADIFRQSDPKKIVVLAGAGISTSSGIPDFRSPSCGLYSTLAHHELPWPEAVFDLEYFKINPSPFFAVARELYPSGFYRPNRVHYFFTLLHKKGRLLRVFTQNIDSLERMAGVPSSRLIEAHGSFATASCISCGQSHPARIVKTAIDRDSIPQCSSCGGIIKPDIVFFGEALPPAFWTYTSDVPQADLVLIMGTSLEVMPFSSVADAVHPHVPRVLMNLEPVGSFRYSQRPNDYLLLGNVSHTVDRLLELLQWQKELDELMEDGETERADYLGLHTSSEVVEAQSSSEPPAAPSSTSSITSLIQPPTRGYTTSTLHSSGSVNFATVTVSDQSTSTLKEPTTHVRIAWAAQPETVDAQKTEVRDATLDDVKHTRLSFVYEDNDEARHKLQIRPQSAIVKKMKIEAIRQSRKSEFTSLMQSLLRNTPESSVSSEVLGDDTRERDGKS